MRIAITIGDPAGIGAEVTLKALLSNEVDMSHEYVIIGDLPVLSSAASLLRMHEKLSELTVIETGAIQDTGFKRCTQDGVCGAASASYIKKAVELALSGEVDALVTAPISKESLMMAGIKWHGHTEMLADLTGTREFAMMLCGGSLRVILVTIHEAIRDVPNLITLDSVEKTIRLANRACAMMNIENPRIAVAALNPHAGEGGLFGSEEKEIVGPAIERMKAVGINASGPYPPDTLFYRAFRGDFDIVVSMYHDQGLIPLKMTAFEMGVNVTVGLPFVRTSPDHGTAYDIAWRGIANPSSMIEALKTAVRLRVDI